MNQLTRLLPKTRLNQYINYIARLKSIAVSDKESKLYPIAPYIDLNERLQDLDSLKHNIQTRQLNTDLAQISQLWLLYQDLKHTRTILESQKVSIAENIKSLQDETEKTKLITHGRIVREDIKLLKEHMAPVENNILTQALALPNVLDPLTPKKEPTTIHTYLTKPNLQTPDHLYVGQILNLVKFINKNSYYLLGSAAEFEISAMLYFSDCLSNNGYVQYSNPDFARSVVIDGCGFDPKNSEQAFSLESCKTDEPANTLHLTGGASLYAFMAYHAKLSLFPTQLPLRYVASGRQYCPKSSNDGLFSVSQASSVQFFIATKQCGSMNSENFHEILGLTIKVYENLGYHFRVVYLPANEIHLAESLRASIQMFSSHLQKYVEVGNVSMYSSYLSKRLLFNYREGKSYHFPNVISGTIVNVPKLLACVLELDVETFEIPGVLKMYL